MVNAGNTWRELVRSNDIYKNLPKNIENAIEKLIRKKKPNFDEKSRLSKLTKEEIIKLIIEKAKQRGDLDTGIKSFEDFKKWFDEANNEAKTYVRLSARTNEYKSEFINKLTEMYPELREKAVNLPDYVLKLSPYLGPFTFRKTGDIFSDLSSFLQYLPKNAIPNQEELLFRIARSEFMPVFNENPKGSINNLKEKISKENNPLVKELEKNILNYCREIYELKIPGHGSIKGQKESLETKIRCFQVEGAKFLTDNKKSLLADEMSMFKTSQAIFSREMIKEKEGKTPTLVICPNSVKEHWVKEIIKWSYENPKIGIVESNKVEVIDRIGKNKKTHNISIKDKEVKDLDFLIINYDLMSRRDRKKSEERFSGIREFNPRYVVLDEVHNAKNPSAIRTRGIKEIVDSAENVSLLSGTPIPGNIGDIYMLLSYLEPETFKIDFDDKNLNSKMIRGFHNLYWQDPTIVKKIFEKKKIRRMTGDYLDKEIPKLENGEIVEIEVPLTGDNAKVYNNVYNNENLSANQSLLGLLEASLDPNLVNPRYIQNRELREKIGRIESCKYRKLDKILEEETKKGRKVLVFTSHFKEGVTSYNKNGNNMHKKEIQTLKDRYKDCNALVIDGDVTTDKLNGEDSEREKIRKKFQRDKNNKVLIATIGTMNEGVDLTAANTIVFLDQAYTPHLMSQAIKRTQRIGEVKKSSVRAYKLISTLEDKKTIDQGIDKMLKEKERIIDYLVNALPLNEEDLKQIESKDITKSPDVRNILILSRKKIGEHLSKYTGKGGQKFKEWIERDEKGAERFAQSYAAHLDYSYAGNTARVYTKIIRGLEKVSNLEKKADLASGPSVLSHFLKKPTTNVDINPYNLKVGKAISAEGSEFKEGMLDNLPLESKSQDLALCSLALHLLSQERKVKKEVIREREKALKEANRILRKDGYFIATIPHNCIDYNNIGDFYKGLEKLGFEVIPELSGYITAEEKDKRFRVYLAITKKVSDSIQENLDKNYFKWKNDEEEIRRYEKVVINKEFREPKKRRKGEGEICITEDKLRCENFSIVGYNGDKKNLDCIIDEYIDLKGGYGK